MNDTEVRAALQELADRVPPSEDPWAEHERRLAERSRSNRGWLAVSAAAACLLLAAGIAVPTLLNRHVPSPGRADDPVVATIGPVTVEDFGFDRLHDYWAVVERRRDPQGGLVDSVCLLPDPRWASSARPPSAEVVQRKGRCRSTPVIDEGPAQIALMYVSESMYVKPCAVEARFCPRFAVLVIATAPEVAQLEVQAFGRTATARELERTDRMALFWTVVRSGGPGLGSYRGPTFVARDVAGRIIAEVALPKGR